MIKKIVVYTYGNRSHKTTIEAAAKFASEHQAELTGLFVRPDILRYSTVYGEFPVDLAQSFFDIQKEYAQNAKKEFDAIVDKYDCATQWHEVDEYEKKPLPHLYTDLLFISQPNTDDDVVFNDTDFLDHLIMDTGLPIIVVPTDWTSDKIAVRPVLGWKETREAVGAVRLTLPLMRAADNVDIVTALKKLYRDADLVRGIEISDYLAAHDVKCEYFSLPVQDDDKTEADVLMRHAHENNRDLIIIGGYGHSRFRQIILGGVTRSLIRNSKIPILVVH